MDETVTHEQSVNDELALDASVLVSLIVVSDYGFADHGEDLSRLALRLRERYAFFELLLISTSEKQTSPEMLLHLGRTTPQVRALHVEGAADFDRMAIHGYQECIGDVVLLTSADEMVHVDLDLLIDSLISGEELVRLRRSTGSLAERISSSVVRFVTGFDVDARFMRTLGINRQLLSELLARPEEIHLFRFTAHTLFARQTVIETDQEQTRGGPQLLLRRIDLVARMVATSAPRLLRIASALCMCVSGVALLSLFYVVGVWLFREEVAEG